MNDIVPPISYSSSEDEFFDATSGGGRLSDEENESKMRSKSGTSRTASMSGTPSALKRVHQRHDWER